MRFYREQFTYPERITSGFPVTWEKPIERHAAEKKGGGKIAKKSLTYSYIGIY
jgi:hypothetical protein